MGKVLMKKMHGSIESILICGIWFSSILWSSITLGANADSAVSIEDIENYLLEQVRLQYEPRLKTKEEQQEAYFQAGYRDMDGMLSVMF